VRRRPATVEEPGVGEHERARAERDDARATLVGGEERRAERPGRKVVRVGPARDDDRVCALQFVQAVGRVVRKPVFVRTGVSPAATRANSYQGSTMSLRSKPKTSHGMARSNVSAPWSITAATVRIVRNLAKVV
jgi:hypothetical protein